MAKYIKTEQGYQEIETTVTPVVNQLNDTIIVPMIGAKMDKNNPVGTGSFSMGRKTGTVIGSGSHAEGYLTTASGDHSHAEGTSTTASGNCSHAEGLGTTASDVCSHTEGSYTTASGYCSHAEGLQATASGNCSHAEGLQATASGYCSHTEGQWTIAKSLNQHVQGAYNVEDSQDKYAHIVGNGKNEITRSNAHTLDWNGVPWFKGRPQFGGTAQDQGSQTVMANGDKELILKSSTANSTKKFKITVDDDYNVSATNTSDSVSKTLATTEYVDSSVSKSNPLNITGATVGQIAKITAVDDTGKPTAWEAVDMPSGGGGGSGGSGKAKSQILINQKITELTASLSVTLEHDFHNLTAIIDCGSDGAALTAGSDGTAVASKIGLLIDTTSFSYNSRKGAYIDTSTGTWKSVMFGAEWSDDLSVFKRGVASDIATGSKSQYYFTFGGTTAMYGTLGTDDNAPRTGKTANIVVNGAYLNVGTRVVLWGEYYE